MQKNKFIVTLVALYITSLIASNVHTFAKENSDLEYPELVVTPKASERVQMEASKEKTNQWKRLIPVQVPAGMTFIAALLQKEKSDSSPLNGKLIGMVIGGGWIAATLAISRSYMPYSDAVEETSVLPSKTPREQLIKERMAEEKISEAGRLATKLKWLSFSSNFIATGLMAARADKNSSSLAFDGLAFIASFTPLIFPLKWETIDCEHKTYKKKIYGPIASATVFPAYDSNGAALGYTPGIALSFNW